MDFNLSPEETYFQRACREFLERACPPDLPREMAEAGSESQLAARLNTELAEGGWTGLAAVGDAAEPTSLVNLGLFCFEAGRVLLPTSFRATALAALAIRLIGDADQQDRYLAEFRAGKLAAVPPELPRGRFSLELSKGRLRASGRQPLVSHAASADLLLLFADADAGRLGLLVPRKAAGVSLCRLPALGGQPVFEVTLDGVELQPEAVIGLGSDHAARAEAWERWLDQALSLLCMEMAGGVGKVVEITAEYVKLRHQFDRPLGSFQAVQHHLANMLIGSYGAHATALQALWTAAHKPRAARQTSTAKLWAARAYRSTTVLAHQLHGGAGYVREASLYLYTERAAADSVSLGTQDDHLHRLWAAGRD